MTNLKSEKNPILVPGFPTKIKMRKYFEPSCYFQIKNSNFNENINIERKSGTLN
jgi:hypothetical protein